MGRPPARPPPRETLHTILFAAQRGEHGARGLDDGVHERLGRLMRQPGGLLDGGDGHAQVGQLDRAPRLRPEGPRQEPEPALRPQAGSEAAQNSSADRTPPPSAPNCPAGGPPAAPAGRATRWRRRSITTSPRSIGAANAKTVSSRPSRSSTGRLSATVTTRCRDLGIGMGPEAPQGRAADRSFSARSMSPSAATRLGELGQRGACRAVVADAVVEASPDPHDPGLLPWRQLAAARPRAAAGRRRRAVPARPRTRRPAAAVRPGGRDRR